MADIKLLPLQEDFANWLRGLGVKYGPIYYEGVVGWMESYARANVEHHTANLRAEIDALRSRLEDATRDKLNAETRAERLAEALQSVERYGADTITGPTTGPDDRRWYRTGVVEMTRRAQAALREQEEGR